MELVALDIGIGISGVDSSSSSLQWWTWDLNLQHVSYMGSCRRSMVSVENGWVNDY